MAPNGLNPITRILSFNTAQSRRFAYSVSFNLFRRRQKVKTFIYFPLEFCLQLFNEMLGISGDIAAFGNVAADDAVDVFNFAFFPGMVGMAKVDRDAKYLL